MRQVFISYSSKDLPQAQAVRHVLEQNGITCWMAPADIPGGSNYTKEIPIAIRNCQAFVLMLSANAQQSHWVLKELDSAVNAGKIILPFQLEDVPLRDEFNFLLTGAQRYDAFQKKSEALNMLVARIRAIISAKPQDGPVQAEAPVEAPVQVSKAPVSAPVCPACDSMDVETFPDRVQPLDAGEHGIRLLWAGACGLILPVAVFFAGIILNTILILSPLDPDIGEFVMYATMALILPAVGVGVWLGSKKAGEQIHRSRIRSHKTVTVCRCRTCQKKFQSVTTDVK